MLCLKHLGDGLGKYSGVIIGGSVKGIGHITINDFLKEVGEDVEKSMQHTGMLLREVADSVANIGIWVISKDKTKAEQGLGSLGSTAKHFGKQVGGSAIAVFEQGTTAIGSFSQGDYEVTKRATKNLAKVAVVSVIAVGLIDVVDGINGVSSDLGLEDNNVTKETGYIELENYNDHEVSPHERVLEDGRVIWMDSDGDTNINHDTGWVQTNPNYKIPTI